MKKITIIGAAGYIGRHMLHPLLKYGYEVHAMDIVALDNYPGIIWHQADVMDHQRTQKQLMEIGAEELIHMAWNTQPGYNHAENNIDWTMATLNILKTFKELGGKRLSVAGSVSEYDFEYGYCVENKTPTKPKPIYGVCKAALFEMVTIFTRQHGISLAWPRIFPSYGPQEKSGRLFPSVINNMLDGKDVPVSHCMKYQDYTYIQDLADGIVALHESNVEGPVNIASGKPVLLRDIVAKIGELLNFKGEIKWGAIPSNFDEPLVVANTERLNREVGFTPKVSLDDGLKMTIEWWKTKHSV